MSRDTQTGTSLDTIIIFTSKMDELAAFYQEGLGIGPYDRLPGHLGCQVGPVYFGFDQVEEGQKSGQGATLWFSVDDLAAVYARLVEMGAEVRYPPTQKPWGATLASLHDPDGNIFGISQRIQAEPNA